MGNFLRYHHANGRRMTVSFHDPCATSPFKAPNSMIEAGLAEVYRGPESGNPYKRQYQAAEETARSAKKNMWVQGDTYESPRAYRKRVGIS